MGDGPGRPGLVAMMCRECASEGGGESDTIGVACLKSPGSQRWFMGQCVLLLPRAKVRAQVCPYVRTLGHPPTPQLLE